MFKILILDSKVATVEIIKEIMNGEGYEARGIGYTENFMQTVYQYKPDMIIMDYNLLSSFNARELCCQLKNDCKTAHIKVVMTCTYSWPPNISGSHEPDSVIYKPFSLEKLTGLVSELLSFKDIGISLSQ